MHDDAHEGQAKAGAERPNAAPPLRLRVTKTILWFLTGGAAVVAVARFLNGLGATTALTDTTPWGLWIGFDVLGGVALAAGGFVVAGTVYVFHLEKYRPALRPAVLTAFLGYVAVVVGLLIDLGKPWNIWRPTLYWQHRSALFEVAWCVMLYLTVLALEFSPVVLERTRFRRLTRIMKRATLPLVILGIMLSTLHQSSLGTLFVLMPFRVHPLWYSPILPVLFFVSAVGLGLGMVMVESMVSAWLYHREVEHHVCRGLARAAVPVLGLYLVIRIGDLWVRGSLGALADFGWPAALFILELAVAVIVPILLFTLPSTRRSPKAIGTGAALIVSGFVLNRIAVSGIATIPTTGAHYFPSWMEIALTVGVVSTAALVFLFFVERFSVYENPRGGAAVLPEPEPVSGVRLDAPWAGAGRRSSLAFVLGAAVAFAMLPADAVHGARPEPMPVKPARAFDALRVSEPGSPVPRIEPVEGKGARPQEETAPSHALLIDGDRDGRFVLFDHEGHQKAEGGPTSCRDCHHANQPLASETACSACHADMFEPTDTFDHASHVAALHGNHGCGECHASGVVKTRATARPCLDCHRTMLVPDSRVKVKAAEFTGVAVGYEQAMHGLCITCHREKEEQKPELHTLLTNCPACHSDVSDEAWKALQPPSPPPVRGAQAASLPETP